MSTAYTVVSLLGAALAAFSAAALLLRLPFVADALTSYGVPRTWWPWLATAKLAGAAGLVAGLWVPWVGLAAGVGLVLYFTGAMVTVLRAHSYSHVPIPLIYLAPAAASVVLTVTT